MSTARAVARRRIIRHLWRHIQGKEGNLIIDKDKTM